jgi:hypothetical protein
VLLLEELLSKHHQDRTHIKANSLENADGCWIWQRTTNGRYPLHGLRNRESRYAHRMAWQAFNEKDIPDGLVINHKCRNALCVNPEHLEVVTQQYNVQIGKRGRFGLETCAKGHPFSRHANGRRRCEVCQNEARRQRNAVNVTSKLLGLA